jgi:ribosomal protein S2
MYKTNFVFLDIIYRKNCFSELQILISSIKKMFSFFFSIIKMEGNILFVATESLYSRILSNGKYELFSKKLICRRPGIFSNLSITKNRVYSRPTFNLNPESVVFLNCKEVDFLLEESKLKNIPAVGLVTSKISSNLIEYPVFVNNIYFHSMYFFVNFFFRLMLLGK